MRAIVGIAEQTHRGVFSMCIGLRAERMYKTAPRTVYVEAAILVTLRRLCLEVGVNPAK
jgi:hypothetical protein